MKKASDNKPIRAWVTDASGLRVEMTVEVLSPEQARGLEAYPLTWVEGPTTSRPPEIMGVMVWKSAWNKGEKNG